MGADNETAVRAILDAWAASIPDHPFKDFGKSVAIVSIAEHPSFTVDLRTLYDVRQKPQEIAKMFDESLSGDLVTKSVPPDSVDVWSFEPGLKKEYVTQEVAIEVPKSFRAISCSVCEGKGTWTCQVCSGNRTVACGDCQGQGKLQCPKCVGRSKINCSYCRGKGYTPGVMKDNKPTADVLCSNCNGAGGSPCDGCNATGGLPCGKCNSTGKLTCSKCQGQGTQPCPQCNAKGKVLRGLSFKASYIPRRERATAHDPETPKELLPAEIAENKGEKALEKEEASVAAASLPSAAAHLKTAFDALIKQADAGKAGQSGAAKIISQLVKVERIPVYAVVYRYSGKIYDVWLAALDNRTVAKESPFKDYAREQAMKAMALASKGQHAEAEALLAKARGIAGGDVSLEHASEVHEGTASAGFFGIHQISSGIAGLALMALLASSQGPTYHLFWPVFSFGIGALAAALLSGFTLGKFKAAWIPNSKLKRVLLSAVLAALCAGVGAAAFSGAHLPLKLDTKDYQARMAERFKNGLAPESVSADDREFLKFLILSYEPLGVDVADAKKAIEDSIKAEEEAKRQAEAQAEAARLEAEKRAKALKEIEQAKKQQKISKKSSKDKKTASKDKKKKKKGWFFGR